MSFAHIAAMSLLCGMVNIMPSAAQQPGPFLTLAELQRDASQLGGKSVTVRCHFSQRKEGATIYDDQHKTTFSVSWSDQIRNTAQYQGLVNANGTDWLVLTGRLDNEKKFVINDGQLDSTTHVTIKIINAKTNRPIPDERLNVALGEDQIGFVAMPTDKNGVIDVPTGNASIIRILSNMYGDCRPRGELYTNYSIANIRESGIATGNLCSEVRPKSKPGELILFEIPKTFIPSYPKPPLSPVSPVPVKPESLLSPAPYIPNSEVACSTPS
jgi:hypothetical protein